MPRSHRGRSTPQSLILPFALTLTTAALASAGLYFFSSESSPPSSYPGSDSEQEPPRRRRRERRRTDRVHDHITEEDTDAIEESRREEELFKKRRANAKGGVGGGIAAYMRGAAAGAMEKMRGDEEEYGFGDEEQSRSARYMQEPKRDIPRVDTTTPITATTAITTTSAVVDRGATPTVPISAVTGSVENTQQYVPPPKPKKTIAIVIQEQKATQGHDSDGDFEEVHGPSRPLLSHLPRPLKLTNTNLYILIYSPHLPEHPLSSPPTATTTAQQPAQLQPVTASVDSLTIGVPSPMPSPSLPPQRFHEDINKSSYELAKSLLPAETPREQIMPFVDHSSVIPMLRQLDPEVVYFEEASVDIEGKIVDELLGGGSVGRVVVVVGGDDDGLISSDDEALQQRKRGEGKWWGENGEVRNRHGRRVEVVEKWTLEEDWRRRVEEE
ncbi:hypothetical protein K440DRAFT_658636 [Wilcoxina mikolae CBS 423.85]|nr:hypothetical protein K440DRAFT_658636 [Wilcoxina mikolae CBS 423.85]